MEYHLCSTQVILSSNSQSKVKHMFLRLGSPRITSSILVVHLNKALSSDISILDCLKTVLVFYEWHSLWSIRELSTIYIWSTKAFKDTNRKENYIFPCDHRQRSATIADKWVHNFRSTVTGRSHVLLGAIIKGKQGGSFTERTRRWSSWRKLRFLHKILCRFCKTLRWCSLIGLIK